MRTRKSHKRFARVWLVITIIAVFAMVAFSLAPMLAYK